MKKLIFVFLSILMLFNVYASADVIDSAVVNTQTNSFRISGNVKEKVHTVIHDNMIEDSEVNNSIGMWETYTKNASISHFTEANGNKCISITNRTSFNAGARIQISDCLNKYGLGTYRLSIRARADSNDYVTKSNLALVIMTHKEQAVKSTVMLSGVSESWQTYTFDIPITSFGTDTQGNPLTECIAGSDNAYGTNGTLYIIGSTTKHYTNSEKTEYVYDLRSYYFDDFTLQYIENLSNADSDESIECTVSVKNGSSVIYEDSFKSAKDGGYDYSAPIMMQSSYDNITVNLKCNTTVYIDETAKANLKNTSPGFSLKKEDGKLRVGVFPYDYISTYGKTIAAFIAALYDENNSLCNVDVKEVALNNSNDMQCLYLDDVLNGNGTVKLFSVDTIGNMKPVASESVMSASKTKRTVYLIGDSICYEYPAETNWPKQGWGVYMKEFFDDSITFVNCSGGGLSTKSYITPTETNNWKMNYAYGTWDKIKAELKPGDFVIMALGVNDTGSNPEDPDTKGTTEAAYTNNVRIFTEETREKGADIIFVTMTLYGGGANTLTFNNTMTQTYRQRAEVMMKAADNYGAVYVDLGKFQLDFYNTMAEKLGGDVNAYNAIREYFHNGDDTLHYRVNGAVKLAQFVSHLIGNSQSELAKYTNDFEIKYELNDIEEQYKPEGIE